MIAAEASDLASEFPAHPSSIRHVQQDRNAERNTAKERNSTPKAVEGLLSDNEYSIIVDGKGEGMGNSASSLHDP